MLGEGVEEHEANRLLDFVEDAVASEHERTARLLEAPCEEAAAAVRAAEEETSFLLDELAELRTMADKIVPEMNREVLPG